MCRTVTKVFFCWWFSKGQEGETTSATLGSLQHRWPHACSSALSDFGSHRFSCGIFSSTVKIQAMECSTVIGCYESPVGLRRWTLKQFREQLNGKISITNDHVTEKRLVHILQCIVDQVFRPLIKQCGAQLSE
jgi:hypothetical protein